MKFIGLDSGGPYNVKFRYYKLKQFSISTSNRISSNGILVFNKNYKNNVYLEARTKSGEFHNEQ
jgi:hypothetical protein